MPKIESYVHGQFCWIDLVAHDMASAQAFYSSLFGWNSSTIGAEGGPPYAQFTLDDEIIAGCGQMNEEMKSQGVPPMWNSYVNVDDIDAVVAKASECGATITVPVMQVMEFGKLAFFMDPQGANIGLWERGTHFGATFVNEEGALCWNELATRDLDAACRFYSDVFGWTYDDNPQSPAPYKMIQCESGMNGGIMAMSEEWGDVPPHWGVYFTVSDVGAFMTRVNELGGKIHQGPIETPVGPMAIAADAQGAVFSVIAIKAPTDA